MEPSNGFIIRLQGWRLKQNAKGVSTLCCPHDSPDKGQTINYSAEKRIQAGWNQQKEIQSWVDVRLTPSKQTTHNRRTQFCELIFMALDLWKSMYLQSCAQKLLCRASFYTKQAFTQSKLLHRVAFIQRSFYAVPAFTRRNCYAEKLLRREAFMQRSFYTEKLVHQRRFYREKLLHTEALTHTEAFTQRQLLHRGFYTERLSHTEALEK